MAFPGLQVVVDVGLVIDLIMPAHQQADISANDLFSLVRKEFFSGAGERQNLPVFVDDDHAIRHRCQDGSQMELKHLQISRYCVAGEIAQISTSSIPLQNTPDTAPVLFTGEPAVQHDETIP